VQALLAASRAAFFGKRRRLPCTSCSQWAGRLAELEAQEAR